METVILDTDLGNDCDDAGAISVLLALQKSLGFHLAAIVSCTSKPYAPALAAALTAEKGVACEIGMLSDGFDGETDHYCSKVCGQKGIAPFAAADAVKLYRKILSAAYGVRIIAVGPLHGLAAVMNSGPDEYSELSGEALFNARVSEINVMGGRFDCAEPEWNMLQDVASARAFLRLYKGRITFCPFEAGDSVLTGANLAEGSLTELCYRVFTKGGGLRPSWDPLTVYTAFHGNLTARSRGFVTVDGGGVTHFTPDGAGPHEVLRLTNAQEAINTIDHIMRG